MRRSEADFDRGVLEQAGLSWLLSAKHAGQGGKGRRKMTLGGCARVRMTISLVMITACVLFCGCGPTTTWSGEACSSDGIWLAVARSEQWSGPGNTYDATTVHLKRLKGSRRPMEVLEFSHQYATMNLKMEWKTPTHLHVTYGESATPGDHVSLDFQAVKCAGIEISAQHVSGDTNDSQRSN